MERETYPKLNMACVWVGVFRFEHGGLYSMSVGKCECLCVYAQV